MVLRGWERAEHAVRQRGTRWLPALLDGVKFRRERRKILDAQRLGTLSAECVDELPLVRRTVVDEEEDATPTLQRELDETEKIALAFPLAERVREPSSGSRAEDVCADVLVVDQDDRIAASSCPATRHDGD